MSPELHRYLTLGLVDGVFRDPPLPPTAALTADIEADPGAVVRQLAEAPPPPVRGPALCALLTAAKLGGDPAAARAVAATLLRTSEDVLVAARHQHALGGWGRGTRRLFADWYLQTPSAELARQVGRCPAIDGFRHRDVLRLAHVRPSDPEREALLGEIVAGTLAAPPPAEAPPRPRGPGRWLVVVDEASLMDRPAADGTSCAVAARAACSALAAVGEMMEAHFAPAGTEGGRPVGRAALGPRSGPAGPVDLAAAATLARTVGPPVDGVLVLTHAFPADDPARTKAAADPEGPPLVVALLAAEARPEPSRTEMIQTLGLGPAAIDLVRALSEARPR